MRIEWHPHAGGCFAASNRHGYTGNATNGRYTIQPISSTHNVERHIGYSVHFINDLGLQPGGLWQSLKRGLATLPEAKRLCGEHLNGVGA